MRFCVGALLILSSLQAAEKLTIDQAIDHHELSDLQFSPDGKRVAFNVQEPPTATKPAQRVTGGGWHFHDLDWLADGKRLVATGTEHPADERRGLERICSIEIDGGKIEELVAPKGPFQRVRVSPKGDSAAFVASPEDGPEAQDLWVLPLDSRKPRNLTGPMKDRPVIAFQWMNDSDFAVLFHNGFHTELVATGGAQRWLVSDDSLDVSAFAVSPQGKVVYVAESAIAPQELWADGKVVSHFNDGLKAAALERPELFRYQSFDGTPVEAALL